MDVILFILSSSVFILGLALFSNQSRAHRNIPFELTPNCLLTRFPLLFVTGPRSIFYFRSYWNIYTSFLAEHGYEVFTLHLPWNNKEQRRKYFYKFLEQQEKHNRHFHLMMDATTLRELEDLLLETKSQTIISLTEITDHASTADIKKSLKAFPIPTDEVYCQASSLRETLYDWTYKLHQLLVKKQQLPSLSTLGGKQDTALVNGQRLLQRAQTLAEMDLRDDRSF